MCIRGDVQYVLCQWGNRFAEWHDSGLEKVKKLFAQLEEIAEAMKAMPVCTLQLCLYMEHCRLLRRVDRILGRDDSDSDD